MIQFKRLEKLAEHLERGKLGHKKFDFSTWNNHTQEFDKRGCGTSGCAIGECPFVFPRSWEFRSTFLSYNPLPVLKGSIYDTNCFDAAQTFFGLDIDQFRHLFLPGKQKPKFYGGKRAGMRATRKDVARNIRAFIKKMRKK